MKPKNEPQQVFVAPRIHTKVRSIRQAIEILLLIVVAIGTIFSLLLPSNFSLQMRLENLAGLISLKKQNFEPKAPSFEERVITAVDKKFLNITSLERGAEGFITIKSSEGVTVIFSTQKDIETQARTLQTVLSKAKIEGKAVSLVDFRFDKIVVRYR